MNKRQYYLKNRDSILAKRAEYRKKNPKKIKDQKRKNYLNNAEAIKKKQSVYRKQNPDKVKISSTNYYAKNKDEILKKRKPYAELYRKKNREAIRLKSKHYNNLLSIKYKKDPEFREKYLTRKKLWLENNPSLKSKYRNADNRKKRVKYKRDPYYKLVISLRSRVRIAVKSQKTTKAAKAEKLVGCSIKYLRNHLEKLFKPGMNWTNHGDWHIDHIYPCSKFDLSDPEQQKICFNFKNLQPLWAEENIKKSNKIYPAHQVRLSSLSPM